MGGTVGRGLVPRIAKLGPRSSVAKLSCRLLFKGLGRPRPACRESEQPRGPRQSAVRGRTPGAGGVGSSDSGRDRRYGER